MLPLRHLKSKESKEGVADIYLSLFLKTHKVIVKESLVELRVDMHFLYVHSQPEGKYIDCIKFSTFHFWRRRTGRTSSTRRGESAVCSCPHQKCSAWREKKFGFGRANLAVRTHWLAISEQPHQIKFRFFLTSPHCQGNMCFSLSVPPMILS